MNEPKNIVIIFTEKSDQVLSEIMKKHKIEEPLEKMVENILSDKLNNIVVLHEIITSFSKGEISEKSLTEEIQQKIGVSEETAGLISKDIIINLIPTLKKTIEEELKKLSTEAPAILNKADEKKADSLPKLKPPIGVEKALQERQTQQKEPEEKAFIGSGKPLPKNETEDEPIKKIPKKRARSIKKEIIETPIVKKSKTSDSYREPIE